jgi:hypothetical protein
MLLTDDKDLLKDCRNLRLNPAEKVHAFIFANLLYQELRPEFPKDIDAIREIIHRLKNDPACPIPVISERTIRRFLADARGRASPGQWRFTRTKDPDTGRETVSVVENLGIRLQYPHPSNHYSYKKIKNFQ